MSTAFDRGVAAGINTMPIFPKNQNRWQQKPTPPEEIERWAQKQAETGIAPVVAHAAYLLNLAIPKDDLWEKSVDALVDELTRAEELGLLGLDACHMFAAGYDLRTAEAYAQTMDGFDRLLCRHFNDARKPLGVLSASMSTSLIVAGGCVQEFMQALVAYISSRSNTPRSAHRVARQQS